jgi:hypothetical protein
VVVVTFYVIDRGVISEEDLREIPNRPLPEQIEVYKILAKICENAAGVLRDRWNRENRAQNSFCGMESFRIKDEASQWREKAKECHEKQEKQEKFSGRCFDISTGPYGSIGLSALVESRFRDR